MPTKYVWEAAGDGDTARNIRAQLGWVVNAGHAYLRFDHLLDEAERRYWDARAAASHKPDTVQQAS